MKLVIIKQVVTVVSAGLAFARALWVTPEVPTKRMAAPRKAFDVTMRDRAFLKVAQ